MTLKDYFKQYWAVYLGSVVLIIILQNLFGRTAYETFLSTWWYLIGFSMALVWNHK